MKIRMIESVAFNSIDVERNVCRNHHYISSVEYDIDENLAKYFIKQKIAEEVKETEFRPYTKVNPEWVGKVINSKVSDSVFSILSVIPEHNKVQTIGSTFSLEKMFEYFTWADGSPFGEQI